jgi:hypothetical protein
MGTEQTDAEAVDMQAMMTAAAEDEETAVEEVEEVVEEVVEETTKEEVVEPVEPTDNAERSKLGRKVDAMWKRFDEQKGTFEKMTEVLEAMIEERNKPADVDSESLITASEAERLAEEKFNKLINKQSADREKYEKGYLDQLVLISADYEPDEYDAIQNIMMEKFNKRHSDNPSFDAHKNFRDAEVAFLRSNKKVVPKGKVPAGAKIATTGAEKVKKKTNPLPKLDAAAQAYINYVRRSRGDAAADKLRAVQE